MVEHVARGVSDAARAWSRAIAVAGEHEDVGTTSLLEVLIDETERRTWFLFEASRDADRSPLSAISLVRSSPTAAITVSTASSPSFLAHWAVPRSSSLRV